MSRLRVQSRVHLEAFVVILGLVLVSGCKSDSKNAVIPGPTDRRGQYSVTRVFDSDTCSNSPGYTRTFDVQISGGGDRFQLEWEGSCRPREMVQDGDRFYWEDTGPFLIAVSHGDPCLVEDILEIGEIEFDSDTIFGEIVYRFTWEGQCDRLLANPCERRYRIEGRRCRGCFEGCD